MTKLRILSAACVAVFTMSVASAQAPAAPPGTVPADGDPTAYRAKEVLGAKVFVSPNQSVGTVDDIVFSDDGSIEYLVVADNGKLVTVPWQAIKYDLKNRAATLPITMEKYRAIPTYTVTQYPTFYAPAYRTEVYRYYGLTPGQLRRIERRR